jgi:hypothetical protein
VAFNPARTLVGSPLERHLLARLVGLLSFMDDHPSFDPVVNVLEILGDQMIQVMPPDGIETLTVLGIIGKIETVGDEQLPRRVISHSHEGGDLRPTERRTVTAELHLIGVVPPSLRFQYTIHPLSLRERNSFCFTE